MNFDNLNDENIVLFAMKHYDNPACKGIEEFNDDFNRIKYIKRLFNRYESNGNLKERLILNHIITFLMSLESLRQIDCCSIASKKNIILSSKPSWCI